MSKESVQLKRRQSIEGKLHESNVIITPDGIRFTKNFYLNLAHKTNNYLVEVEEGSVFSHNLVRKECILYFELNPTDATLTVEKTESLKFIDAPYSESYPSSPEVGQLFFNLTDFTLRQWNGFGWIEKIGIILAHISSDNKIVNLYHDMSQINVNVEIISSKVVKTRDLDVILVETKTGFELLTEKERDTIGFRKLVPFTFDNKLCKCISSTPMDAFTVVSRDENYSVSRASMEWENEATGLLLHDVLDGDTAMVLRSGYLINRQWAWEEPPMTPLYFDVNSRLTTVSPLQDVGPNIKYVQKVGYIVDPTTIFFYPEQRLIL